MSNIWLLFAETPEELWNESLVPGAEGSQASLGEAIGATLERGGLEAGISSLEVVRVDDGPTMEEVSQEGGDDPSLTGGE